VGEESSVQLKLLTLNSISTWSSLPPTPPHPKINSYYHMTDTVIQYIIIQYYMTNTAIRYVIIRYYMTDTVNRCGTILNIYIVCSNAKSSCSWYGMKIIVRCTFQHRFFSEALEFTMALNCIILHQKRSEGFVGRGAALDPAGSMGSPLDPRPESMA